MKSSTILAVGVIALNVQAFAFIVDYEKSHVELRVPPGPEWVHDRGSLYWTCTSDGHALIKDTDTGSTMLARDDRKCDSGG